MFECFYWIVFKVSTTPDMASKHIVHGCNYLPPHAILDPRAEPGTPSDPLDPHSNHKPHSSTKFNYEINFISLKTQHATSNKREKRAENREQKAKGQANIKPLNIDGQ